MESIKEAVKPAEKGAPEEIKSPEVDNLAVSEQVTGDAPALRQEEAAPEVVEAAAPDLEKDFAKDMGESASQFTAADFALDDDLSMQDEGADYLETVGSSRLEEEKISFLDVIRKKWDAFSLQSNLGSVIIRVLLALIVFEVIRITCFYGLQFENSLMSTFYAFAADDKIFMLFQAGIAIIWFILPGLGTCLYAILMFCSIGGISPIVMGLAALLLFLAGTEKASISVAAMLIPVMTICLSDEQWVNLFGEGVEGPFMAHTILSTSLGIFFTLFAAFLSLRMIGGATRTIAFLLFATVAFTFGQLVKIQDANEHNLLGSRRNYWPLFTNNGDPQSKAVDHFVKYLMIPGGKILAVFLVIAIIFVILANIKFKKGKFNLDIRDAVAFVGVGGLLCAAGPVITQLTGLECSFYSFKQIALQTALAYVATRPIAGRSPTMAATKLSGGRKFIFISYAHNDIKRVKPYLQILKKEGYDFWYDNNIRAGTEWQDVIAYNLAMCSYFLAFVSKDSVFSDYCIKEINYATSKKKPMTAIMLDNVNLPPVLEMHMASLQAIERRKYSSDKACLNVVLGLEEVQKCKL